MPEDQLTELLALLMKLQPQIACSAASRWRRLGNEQREAGAPQPMLGDSVRVRTQVPGRGWERVDLEIRGREEHGKDVVVWVEVKRDMWQESRPGQVLGYEAELEKRCGDGGCAHAVVYLTRAGVDRPPDFTGCHDDWTNFGRWLFEEFGEDLMVRDFVEYLKEEWLLMTALTADDLEVLKRQHRARLAAEQLLEQANVGIEEFANERALGEWPSEGRWPAKFSGWAEKWGALDDMYWSYVFPGDDEASSRALEWGLFRPVRGSDEEELVFRAGLDWWYRDGAQGDDRRAQVEKLLEQLEPRFHPYEISYGEFIHRKLHRSLSVKELEKIVDRGLEAQARCLAEFVVDALGASMDAVRAIDG
jgi:hypothetical protein